MQEDIVQDEIVDSSEMATLESSQSLSKPEAENDSTPQDESASSTSESAIPDESDPVIYDGLTKSQIMAMRREYGKLPQTQNELKIIKQQSEALKKFVLSSPDRTKEALLFDGYTEADANAYVENIKRQNPEMWNQVQKEQAATNTQVDVAAMVRKVREEERMQLEREKAQQEYAEKFWNVLPALKPDFTSTNSARQNQIKQGVASLVEQTAQALREDDASLGLDESLRQAYREVTGQNVAEMEQVREKAKLEGMLAVNADRASTRSPAVGGSQAKSSVKLTSEQQSIARTYNLTDEEYAAYL